MVVSVLGTFDSFEVLSFLDGVTGDFDLFVAWGLLVDFKVAAVELYLCWLGGFGFCCLEVKAVI